MCFLISHVFSPCFPVLFLFVFSFSFVLFFLMIFLVFPFLIFSFFLCFTFFPFSVVRADAKAGRASLDKGRRGGGDGEGGVEEEVKNGTFESDPAVTCFSFLFFLYFFSNVFHYWHWHQSFIADVASVVGAPWRCGVLTTQGGKSGIGLGHSLGREHDSTPHSGVEAPTVSKMSLSRLDYCCCTFTCTCTCTCSC